MTQTLDVHERISELGGARAASQSATADVTASKAARFVFAFGISFAILYTLFEQMNWPLFTYHPAVGKLDFWMQRARSGEGPGMYWYGWLALAFPCAALVGWVVNARFQQMALPGDDLLLRPCHPLVGDLCDSGSHRWPHQLRHRSRQVHGLVVGYSRIGRALSVISYFVPLQLAQRVFTSWLLIMPIGGLLILGYSLKSFFLR